MELSQEFLIDMALNVGGYLFAGLLSIVIYSLFRKRTRVTAGAEAKVSDSPATRAPSETAERETRRLEFVKLGQRSEVPRKNTEAVGGGGSGSASDRRNRTEIIRVARTMLRAGASNDRIKRLIPISDAELSLLSLSKS